LVFVTPQSRQESGKALVCCPSLARLITAKLYARRTAGHLVVRVTLGLPTVFELRFLGSPPTRSSVSEVLAVILQVRIFAFSKICIAAMREIGIL
jgi:hypothetical protein